MYQSVNKLLRSIPGGIPVSGEETAFPAHLVPQVLDIALQNQWIVLGGDVLNKDLQYTYDNWYYDPDMHLSLSNNVANSIQKCNQYISKYIERNGNDFLYVLVISNSYLSAGIGTVSTAD